MNPSSTSTKKTASFTAKLNVLMGKSSCKEMECRECLGPSIEWLVPYTGTVKSIDKLSELPGASGPSDLVLLCDREEHGESIRSAYVWEIKAPQEALFSKCNKNRARPSAALNKAENQLLHYWDDCRNEQFRASHCITSLDEIHLGGIIIGQKNNKVSGAMKPILKQALYKKAIRLRKAQFYKQSEIRILLWDDIIGFLNGR